MSEAEEYDASLLEAEDPPFEVDLYGETDKPATQSFTRHDMEVLQSLSQPLNRSIQRSNRARNRSNDEEELGHPTLSALTFVTPTDSETNTPRQPNAHSIKQSIDQSLNEQSVEPVFYHSNNASITHQTVDQSVADQSVAQVLEQTVKQSISRARSIDINIQDPPPELPAPSNNPPVPQEESKEQLEPAQCTNQPAYQSIHQSMIVSQRSSIIQANIQAINQVIDQIPLDREDFVESSKPLLFHKIAATLAAPLCGDSNSESVSQTVSVKLKAQALECAINLAIDHSPHQSINQLIHCGVLTEALFLSCDASPILRILSTCLIDCLIVRCISQAIDQSITESILKRAPRWMNDQVDQVRSNGATIIDHLIHRSISQLLIINPAINQSMLSYLIGRLKVDHSHLARASILPIVRRTFKNNEARIVCRYHEFGDVLLQCLKEAYQSNQQLNQPSQPSDITVHLTIYQTSDQSDQQSVNRMLEQTCLLIGEYALNKQDAQILADIDEQAVNQQSDDTQNTFTGLLIGLLDHPSVHVARAAATALGFTTINQKSKKQAVKQSAVPPLIKRLEICRASNNPLDCQSINQFTVSLLQTLTNVCEVPTARKELSANDSVTEMVEFYSQSSNPAISETAKTCLSSIMWKP